MLSKNEFVGSHVAARYWNIENRSVTAVQEIVAGFIVTFKEFPPRQKPAKFNVDDVMTQMFNTGSH